MNKQYVILKVIGLLGLGFGAKVLIDMVNKKKVNDIELGYLSVNNLTRADNRDEIKDMISRVYRDVLKVNVASNTLNSWTNKLLSKQSTLYNFLLSVITPKINSLNITTLAQSLYIGVLGRQATMNESSKLVSVFNDELRQYGSKERALKKMLTYFVKMSSIVSYCNKLGIKAV